MGQRGPLVTAFVVVGGLVGLMTANAAGGLVTAAPSPSNAAQQQAVQEETGVPAEPPATTTPPATEVLPPTSTEEPPPPPAPTFPAEVVYAGKDAGGAMAIAIAVKGDEASAYLCDGAAVESWLRGTATDGKLELASKDGSTTLSAGLSGTEVTGKLSVGGQPELDFTIAVAPPPAGLYRGEDGQTTVGWIILSDGTQVGIASSASGDRPAPPLDPARGSVTVGGSTVRAEKVAGDTTFG